MLKERERGQDGERHPAEKDGRKKRGGMGCSKILVQKKVEEKKMNIFMYHSFMTR